MIVYDVCVDARLKGELSWNEYRVQHVLHQWSFAWHLHMAARTPGNALVVDHELPFTQCRAHFQSLTLHSLQFASIHFNHCQS